MGRSVRVKLVVAGVVAAVIGVFVAAGGWEWLSGEGNVERALTETGPVGPAVFVLVMWLTQPFGMPGVVLIVPAGLVWSAPLAIALSWMGNMGASFIGFAGARWLARDWIVTRIPSRLHRFDDRLSAGGVAPVALLRFLTGQIPAADWLLGVSKVSPRNFLIGTGIGIIPLICLFVLAGSNLTDLWDATPLWVRVTVGVLVAVVVVARVTVMRRRVRATVH